VSFSFNQGAGAGSRPVVVGYPGGVAELIAQKLKQSHEVSLFSIGHVTCTDRESLQTSLTQSFDFPDDIRGLK
jgi:hypothetical protein